MSESNSTTRAMSRADALMTIEEIMVSYEQQKMNGEIVIDIRGGKTHLG